MEDRIEALEQARRRMLMGFLIAFVAWQVPTILEDTVAAQVAPGLARVFGVLAAVGGIVWVVSSLRLWRLQRQVARDPEAAVALDDERVREARSRALVFGFWALVVYMAMARMTAFVLQISAATVSQSGLVVAASAAIGAFLVYDRG